VLFLIVASAINEKGKVILFLLVESCMAGSEHVRVRQQKRLCIAQSSMSSPSTVKSCHLICTILGECTILGDIILLPAYKLGDALMKICPFYKLHEYVYSWRIAYHAMCSSRLFLKLRANITKNGNADIVGIHLRSVVKIEYTSSTAA
jgi:hypothetical protein